jgi:hypothetical protein
MAGLVLRPDIPGKDPELLLRRRLAAIAVQQRPLVLTLALVLGWPLIAASQPTPPAPPKVFLETSHSPPSGRTISVAAGGDLHAALKSAQPGDVITIEPGATFQGNFALPRKGGGTAWITIRSGAPDDKLPAPGTRVSPAVASLMPKILSPDSNPAVYTEPGAHNYRLIGLEISAASNVKQIYSIVAFGGVDASLDTVPHDLIIDRCYIHGFPTLQTSRGVLLNSASSAVIDSHISEIHGAGFDTQAILGFNGPGPFKIVNNFLEGAGENIMFGGADPRIPDLVPSDIEIRRNHIFKPLSWHPGSQSPGVPKWTVKNLLELKNAQRVIIEGNLLENMWGGSAVVLTPRNQGGRAPWSIVQDVLMRNNVIKNSTSGFSLSSTDNERSSQPTKRIAIVNNLWLLTRTFFGVGAGGRAALDDLLVDHNTAVPVGYSAYRVGGPTPPGLIRFRMTNNLIGFGAYGVTLAKPDDSVARFAPGAVIAKNALVNISDTGDGQGVKRNRPPGINQAMYMSFATSTAAGVNPSDGTLTTESPLIQAGTDGKDIGVDFDQLRRAMTDSR